MLAIILEIEIYNNGCFRENDYTNSMIAVALVVWVQRGASNETNDRIVVEGGENWSEGEKIANDSTNGSFK